MGNQATNVALLPVQKKSMLRRRPRLSAPAAVERTALPPGRGEDWKVDAHWTALTGHLASMYFPNEG